MRSHFFAAAIVLIASTLAHADAKDEVTAATKKLAESDYSWKTSVEGAQGPNAATQEGKTTKDGLIWVAVTMGDNKSEFIKKGDKGAIKTADGWQSIAELAESQPDPNGARIPGRYVARLAQTMKTPATQLKDIVEKLSDLKKTDDAYTADLSEEQVKAMMTRNRPTGANPPQIADAKGSTKIWLKDGVISRLQYTVQGKITYNNQDRDINRTTTIEISDIDKTKIEVPAQAKEKAKLD